VASVQDLWMNDEVLLQISSDEGVFSLSKDGWDIAFIMAENNQHCIKIIDKILNNSSLFQKEEL